MKLSDTYFELRLARTEADLRSAQSLRYRIFVEELGAGGPMVDHDARLEIDAFDAHADHLMLLDHRLPEAERTIGVYRVLRQDQADAAGRYYSEIEYDLASLRGSGRRLLELGRSCVAPDYRGGTAMMHLWQGLSAYVKDHGIEVLFGVASFPGTDADALAEPLSLLHHSYRAEPALRPVARATGRQRMDLMPLDEINRAAAMRATPSLIKAYLRLGGVVGEGAFIDREFNCTDVCMILDVDASSGKHRAIYDAAG